MEKSELIKLTYQGAAEYHFGILKNILNYEDFCRMAERQNLVENVIEIFESKRLSVVEINRQTFGENHSGLSKDELEKLHQHIRSKLVDRLYIACADFILDSADVVFGDERPFIEDLIEYGELATITAILKENKEVRVKQQGRPTGTGWFKNAEEFKDALWDVFGLSSTRPSEQEALDLLNNHRLCRRMATTTKTLRDKLPDAGFNNYHHAWRVYLQSRKNGK